MVKSHDPWTIKERVLKYQNPWVKVYEDQVIRPDGKEGTHVFFDLKKGSAVLPIDDCMIKPLGLYLLMRCGA